MSAAQCLEGNDRWTVTDTMQARLTVAECPDIRHACSDCVYDAIVQLGLAQKLAKYDANEGYVLIWWSALLGLTCTLDEVQSRVGRRTILAACAQPAHERQHPACPSGQS